ncbi:MAG: L,D-transpeptidase, partial [Polyangiales bacterium]
VTGVQLKVREKPDPEATVLGWVRVGSRIRLTEAGDKSSTCASGWHRIWPRGWVCAGEGVQVGGEPPQPVGDEGGVEPPPRDGPLPYAYFFIKEPQTPEYHRLPSRDEQRAAQEHADHYLELLDESESKAERFREGKLPGPKSPAVVRRYLRRGFYVAGTGVEVRAFRRFVRTVWGSYIKQQRTTRKTGYDYRGIELAETDHELPVAFALRTIRPLVREDDDEGNTSFRGDEEAEPIERQTVVEGWIERRRVGDHIYHVFENDQGEERYTRAWFIGVAEKIEPPFELTEEDEPWVHVALEEQTLVVYRGTEPVFVTLVSSGLDEHATPTGTFQIHAKHITDTMADLGPEAGDEQYSIHDVPWTQYFDGSIALHGAFWHGRFGLQKSHGCVNLSPHDAHRVFEMTWPEIPEGWHGVKASEGGFLRSHVVVTE